MANWIHNMRFSFGKDNAKSIMDILSHITRIGHENHKLGSKPIMAWNPVSDIQIIHGKMELHIHDKEELNRRTMNVRYSSRLVQVVILNNNNLSILEPMA